MRWADLEMSYEEHSLAPAQPSPAQPNPAQPYQIRTIFMSLSLTVDVDVE